MPATTPLGIPFPLGTDRVSDGDNAIQALAQWLDSYVCWGAAWSNGGGAGIGQTFWQNTLVSSGSSPGVVVSSNGITVPRKGYYLLQYNAQFQWNQAVNAAGAIFIGDGTTIWYRADVATLATENVALGKPAFCQGVALLSAGQMVRCGVYSIVTSGGVPSNGAANNLFSARLMQPVA